MSINHLQTLWSLLKNSIGEQKPYKNLRIICIIGAILVYIYFLIQRQPVPIQSSSLQVYYTIQQRFERPAHIDRDHGFCGPCPGDKQLSKAWQLSDFVAHISPKSPFLVNIGAASTGGGKYDPVFPLLTGPNSSFGALLIDRNTDPAVFNAYPNRSNIRIVDDFVWAESVVQNIFEKYNVPKNFTVLKIDIDSYECSLLESILRADYRPQLIHTEFNPIFPPPVIFMPIYNSTAKNNWSPALWHGIGPFYGCSLSALSKILKSFDYVLVDVDFWDVTYIQRQVAESIHIQVPANDEVAYEYGFLGHSCAPYCRQNDKLFNDRIENAIKFALNQSNFTAYMTNVIDLFAPTSGKDKHPYVIIL